MDFGEILEQWESETKNFQKKDNINKTSGQEWRNKKPNAPKKEIERKDEKKITEKQFEKKINVMELALRRYGIVDKDALIEKIEREKRTITREDLRKKTPDATIDLHGLTYEEAWKKLEAFVTECVRRKLYKILIIHGKGNHSNDNPVLRNMVRTFVEKDYRLGESGHPERKNGGKGATWVILRQ